MIDSESSEISFTHYYDIRYYVRKSSITDEEQSGDRTGYSRRTFRRSYYRLLVAPGVTSAAGHRLERL